MLATKTKRIQQLNDALRTQFKGGRVVITMGIQALEQNEQQSVLAAVKEFTEFNAGNDPHGEHDFALIETQYGAVMFKIDYYDLDYQFASPDPSDPDVTARVMTVMLAAEY